MEANSVKHYPTNQNAQINIIVRDWNYKLKIFLNKHTYIYSILQNIAFTSHTFKKINTYNHATSNLAIYSHETSQDKLSEA